MADELAAVGEETHKRKILTDNDGILSEFSSTGGETENLTEHVVVILCARKYLRCFYVGFRNDLFKAMLGSRTLI